jgi:probable rRNA maturation factor
MRILIKNQQRYRRLNKARIIRAVRKILSLLNQPMAELSILFVGDKKMRQLNTTFRGVSKTTDVLSFPQTTSHFSLPTSQFLLGDIVINIPRAASQARESGTGFYKEVYRLLIHGILHLLGYEHEKSRHRARVMKKKEEELLKCL